MTLVDVGLVGPDQMTSLTYVGSRIPDLELTLAGGITATISTYFRHMNWVFGLDGSSGYPNANIPDIETQGRVLGMLGGRIRKHFKEYGDDAGMYTAEGPLAAISSLHTFLYMGGSCWAKSRGAVRSKELP